MSVSPKSVQEMISLVPDPAHRSLLGKIAFGKIVKAIYCNHDCPLHPAGELIGYIYSDGRVESVKNDKGESFLRSSRDRLDGVKGFECWCGNDSRLAAHEKDDIDMKGNPPTKEGLQNIYEKLKNNPASYPVVNGEQEVDGFTIRNFE